MKRVFNLLAIALSLAGCGGAQQLQDLSEDCRNVSKPVINERVVGVDGFVLTSEVTPIDHRPNAAQFGPARTCSTMPVSPVYAYLIRDRYGYVEISSEDACAPKDWPEELRGKIFRLTRHPAGHPDCQMFPASEMFWRPSAVAPDCISQQLIPRLTARYQVIENNTSVLRSGRDGPVRTDRSIYDRSNNSLMASGTFVRLFYITTFAYSAQTNERSCGEELDVRSVLKREPERSQ